MPVSEVSFVGGARVGWVNASWPFARLRASAKQLSLSSLGTYEFRPEEVASIDCYGAIPLLASGLRIVHSRNDYPERMIFWCMGNREHVLAELDRVGFRPSGHAAPRAAGFPFRWSLVIAAILLWNLFIFLDRPFDKSPTGRPGFGALSALAVMFGLSVATLASTCVQGLVLREGHAIGEVKSFLWLLAVIAGLLTLFFGIDLAMSGSVA